MSGSRTSTKAMSSASPCLEHAEQLLAVGGGVCDAVAERLDDGARGLEEDLDVVDEDLRRDAVSPSVLAAAGLGPQREDKGCDCPKARPRRRQRHVLREEMALVTIDRPSPMPPLSPAAGPRTPWSQSRAGLRHAAPRVADLEAHIARAVLVPHAQEGGGEAHHALVGELERVDEEVEQAAHQAGAVAAHLRYAIIQRRLEAHVLLDIGDALSKSTRLARRACKFMSSMCAMGMSTVPSSRSSTESSSHKLETMSEACSCTPVPAAAVAKQLLRARHTPDDAVLAPAPSGLTALSHRCREKTSACSGVRKSWPIERANVCSTPARDRS